MPLFQSGRQGFDPPPVLAGSNGGTGRHSGFKTRRRKAWGFDSPFEHMTYFIPFVERSALRARLFNSEGQEIQTVASFNPSGQETVAPNVSEFRWIATQSFTLDKVRVYGPEEQVLFEYNQRAYSIHPQESLTLQW